MIITSIGGEVLEKSKSNSPEDFFNRSEASFLEGKQERKLTVLYVRYFDEKIAEYSSFENDELFEVDGRVIHVRDIIALLALNTHQEYAKRHRVYINEEKHFGELFNGLDRSTVEDMVKKIVTEGRLDLS